MVSIPAVLEAEVGLGRESEGSVWTFVIEIKQQMPPPTEQQEETACTWPWVFIMLLMLVFPPQNWIRPCVEL